MAWNDGLSDGFWGAVSTNVGQLIGAASGTTKHQADAQIAMANQNRADQQQTTSFLQSLISSNNNPFKSVPGQNNNQIWIIAILVVIIFLFLLRRK